MLGIAYYNLSLERQKHRGCDSQNVLLGSERKAWELKPEHMAVVMYFSYYHFTHFQPALTRIAQVFVVCRKRYGAVKKPETYLWIPDGGSPVIFWPRTFSW